MRRRPGRPALVNGLHLAVLWSLAVAQPLFDLLGRNAAFFAIRRSTSADIVIFAVALILLPPLIMFAVEALLGLLDERVGRAAHLVFVAGLVGLIALDVLKRTDGSSGVLIPLAVIVGAAAAALYARVSAVRMFLTVLGPAPVLFALLFLFNTPVHKLINGDDAQQRAAAPAGPPTPVVMVVFDEFPITSLLGADGQIDAKRYPNFATLARDSTWFRNVAAVDASTQVAVPAILTGRRPTPNELPTFEDHPDNLFTLLGRNRRMRVHESITSLCPQTLCPQARPGFDERMRSLASDLSVVTAHILLPNDLRRRLPSIDTQWQDFVKHDERGSTASDVVHKIFDKNQPTRDRDALFGRFVDGVRRGVRGGSASLDFFHVLLPHVPWEYLPDGRRYGQVEPIPGLTDESWSADPAAPKAAMQRHIAQVGFVDRIMGQLLRALKSTGAYDDALLVITADHGVSMRPSQSRRGAAIGNAGDIMPVPLFVKAPGQRRGRVVTTQLQTTDILPTIASVLNMKMPWATEGRSGFADGADRAVVKTTTIGQFPVEMSADRLDALRAAALRRQVATVGEGGFPSLRSATAQELMGRRVAAAAPAADGAGATVDDASTFQTVDLGGPLLPAHVTGEVRGIRAGEVAIAINGRIGAVAPLIHDEGKVLFSALVPPSLLRSGANGVEVLAVSDHQGAPRLTSLVRVARGQGVLTLEDGSIRGSGGRRFRIVNGALAGGVDRSVAQGDLLELSGWAVDPRARRPVEQIVAFGDDGMLFSGRPTVARPDLVGQYKAPPADLGFVFHTPSASVSGRPKVFALRDGVASPLQWFCGGGVTQEIGC